MIPEKAIYCNPYHLIAQLIKRISVGSNFSPGEYLQQSLITEEQSGAMAYYLSLLSLACTGAAACSLAPASLYTARCLRQNKSDRQIVTQVPTWGTCMKQLHEKGCWRGRNGRAARRSAAEWTHEYSVKLSTNSTIRHNIHSLHCFTATVQDQGQQPSWLWGECK